MNNDIKIEIIDYRTNEELEQIKIKQLILIKLLEEEDINSDDKFIYIDYLLNNY